MKKVLMLLKTTGLQYDDRVRKEALSLLKLDTDVCIGVLDDSNLSRSGQTDYGVRYHSVSIGLRRVFPSARGLFWKVLEL